MELAAKTASTRADDGVIDTAIPEPVPDRLKTGTRRLSLLTPPPEEAQPRKKAVPK